MSLIGLAFCEDSKGMMFLSRQILKYKLQRLRHFAKHNTPDCVANLISRHLRQILWNITNTNLSNKILLALVDDLEIAYLAAMLGTSDVVMLIDSAEFLLNSN
jgi:hypothetical protein